ncbi:MAG: hypothetical protein MJ142_07460 [Clostridia bacterium]|nr:hypothetical protein [Clostridia bacterium]
MKKLIAMMLALALLLPCVCALAAETPADTALAMYDALENLLLRTDNVTLTGTANLYLNGDRFKTLDARYVAGGENSLWALNIFTPRAWDPLDKASGFTVVRNGTLVYSMEVMKPGLYSMSGTYTPDTLLTETVQLRQLLDLGRVALGLFAGTAGESLTVSTDAAGNTVLHVTVKDGEGAGLVDNVLNLVAQSVFRRYRHLDFDYMNANAGGADVFDYGTVFEGLMYCMKSLSLGDTDVTLVMDPEGRPFAAEGKVNVNYVSRAGSKHLLTAEGSVTVSNYGTSEVKEFDAADYGVLPDGDSTPYLTLNDEALTAVQERAKSICAEAGFAIGENYTCGTYGLNSYNGVVTVVELTDDSKGITYNTMFDADQNIVQVQDIYGSYLNGRFDNNVTDVRNDPAKLAALLEKVNAFIEAEPVCPGKTKDMHEPQVSLEWMDGDIHYIQLDYFEDEVAVVVMLEPEWRIVYFSTVSNG